MAITASFACSRTSAMNTPAIEERGAMPPFQMRDLAAANHAKNGLGTFDGDVDTGQQARNGEQRGDRGAEIHRVSQRRQVGCSATATGSLGNGSENGSRSYHDGQLGLGEELLTHKYSP